MSKKDCENFIANSRDTLRLFESELQYINDKFKQNFLEKFKFYDTDDFGIVCENFKEALEKFEEIYWVQIYYNGKKFRKMFITYN